MSDQQIELTFDGSNIAGAIQAAHDAVLAAQKSAVKHAAECGRLLAAAKETVPHGSWTSWISENCEFSMRTAQLYMKLADYLADGDPAKAQRVADSSLREVGALLLDEKNTHEETRKKLLKKELTEAFSQSWMTSGPMERRALMVLFGLRKIGPRKEHLRFLRWLNKHDENGRIAGTPELQNAGLDTGRLIETIKLDPKRHVTASEARELFELAGKPSATLAAVMFENGYFDLEAGVMIPEAFRN